MDVAYLDEVGFMLILLDFLSQSFVPGFHEFDQIVHRNADLKALFSQQLEEVGRFRKHAVEEVQK
jgi:hypothetical protein